MNSVTSFNSGRYSLALLFVVLSVVGGCRSSQDLDASLSGKPWSELPEPDHANVAYGEHERNVLDVWLADANEPTPMVIYFHGGGFRKGDKLSLRPELLQRLLKSGISVATINYRLTDTHPFPAPHEDAARAVQFIRYNAEKWNLDKERFGATGRSAGAGISLWLSFHDDMADPAGSDPVSRESTRVSATAVYNAQSSYDPRFARSIGLPRLEQHDFFLPFYGITAEEIHSTRAYALYEEAAAINHLTKDDNVPVQLIYNANYDVPVHDNSPMSVIVHHVNFGRALKEEMDQLGVECTIMLSDDSTEWNRGIPESEFFQRHLLGM